MINALDLLVPLHFRKIYLEDVVESLDQKEYDMHQHKIRGFWRCQYTERSRLPKLKNYYWS